MAEVKKTVADMKIQVDNLCQVSDRCGMLIPGKFFSAAKIIRGSRSCRGSALLRLNSQCCDTTRTSQLVCPR